MFVAWIWIRKREARQKTTIENKQSRTRQAQDTADNITPNRTEASRG
jgi:hypothetical protein